MNLTKLMDLISLETYLAVDTETTGLDAKKDQITDLVIAGATWSECVSIKVWDGEKLVELVDRDTVINILNLVATKKLIMHNAQFDQPMILSNYGVDLTEALHCDTMLAAHTVDENRQNYGLKRLGTELLGIGAEDEKDELMQHLKDIGAGTAFYKADPSIRGKYAAKDGRLTYDLFVRLDAELREQRLDSFFYDDEVMPLLKYVTIPMETRGVKLDMEKLHRLKQEIDADINALEDKIQAEISPLLKDFNDWYVAKEYPVKLSGEFLHELMTMLAPEGWPKTKTGSYSLSATEVCKAKKKGLIPSVTSIESYIGVYKDNQKAEPMERIPADVVKNIQRILIKKSGQKYIFNLKSKDHLKRLFFGYGQTKSVLKETPTSLTDKGNPQVDEDFLDIMAKKYSWAADLITYNKLNKIVGSYYNRFLEEQQDGIFYPTFFQHRTVSGRYGSDFQQLNRPIETPQEGDLVAKYTNEVRKLFVARPGNIFVDVDYESLEPHVFSHISNDIRLQNIFNMGHDFYSTIAIGAENLTEYSADKSAENYLGKKNKELRQKSKAYSLGIPYGLGDFKLSKDLNISQTEAAKIICNYFTAFPELKKWFDDTKVKVCKYGYIRTEAGRIRRFPLIKEMYAKYGEVLFDSLELWKQFHDSPKTYAEMKQIASLCRNELNNARNVQIQSLGASIVNRASILIAKELPKFTGAYLVCQVHDQIVVECQEADKDRVAEMVQRIMETCWKLSVKLKAPPSFGYNLGESKG